MQREKQTSWIGMRESTFREVGLRDREQRLKLAHFSPPLPSILLFLGREGKAV